GSTPSITAVATTLRPFTSVARSPGAGASESAAAIATRSPCAQTTRASDGSSPRATCAHEAAIASRAASNRRACGGIRPLRVKLATLVESNEAEYDTDPHQPLPPGGACQG